MKTKLLIATMVLCTFGYTTHAQLLPDFTKTDCAGNTHHLFDDLAAGNAVILNFCAGWCAPCREADPILEEVYQDACQGTGNVKVYGMLFETNGGEASDCTFGNQYAAQYGLTFPIITDIGTMYPSYSGLTGNYFNSFNLIGVPAFLVIIPNVNDPANSEVITIFGYSETLRSDLEEVLNKHGFPVIPPVEVDVTGDFCGDNPYAVLTSNIAEGNQWSTGETTQSIIVYKSGSYDLSVSRCNGIETVSTPITLNPPPPVAGIATISDSMVCDDQVVEINYTGGTGTYVTWEYAYNDEDTWYDSGYPADQGPLGVSLESSYKFRLRVRVQYGQTGPFANCGVSYSNEIQLIASYEHPGITIESVPEPGEFTGGNPNMIYLGYGPQSTTLNTTVSGGTSFTYQWTGNNLDCYDCADPVFTPGSEGTYSFEVEVANEFGCTTSETIEISVQDIYDPNHNRKILMCIDNTNKSIDKNAVASVFQNNPNSQLGQCDLTKSGTLAGKDYLAKGTNDFKTSLFNLNDDTIKVFPNPTNSNVTVSFRSEAQAELSFSLIDITGKVVYEVMGKAVQGYITRTIDMTPFNNGVYILSIRNGESVVRKQIIKNN
ncbi:MAG: T9SS type A sorting domain-containing protein [Prolixibacteraceae bacterium]|nr:T9SS type A sorting domain-containing protein [Prolixibacteraceae bacterium]